MSYKSRFY